MPARLRCRTLVDTNVLLYVLCCSVQGQFKAVLLYLRYVDTAVGFRSFACAFVVCAEEEQVQKTKTSWLLGSLEAIWVAS